MSTTADTSALAERTRHLNASPIGAILGLSGSADTIPLAAGSPAPETFCAGDVAEVVAELLAAGPKSLQYGDTAGLPILREWLAHRESTLLGRPVDPARVILAHGSQQALDLVCKALLDPGDVVLVDQPTYPGALQVFNLYQATVAAIPLAAQPDLRDLVSTLERGMAPKVLYVVPTFANPTGLSLSASQRELLVELAERYGFVVVEDDPYHELHFTDPGNRTPPLAALSDDVVRLGSFSKVLFPAARLGYSIAPEAFAGVLGNFKQAADLGNSLFMERIVFELVSGRNVLPDVLSGSRAIYRNRRDTLMASLTGSFGETLSFPCPDGGFFLWARLSDGLNATRLLTESLKNGVSFVPGEACFAAEPDLSTLRLSYSCASLDQLRSAGPLLATALSRMTS